MLPPPPPLLLSSFFFFYFVLSWPVTRRELEKVKLFILSMTEERALNNYYLFHYLLRCFRHCQNKTFVSSESTYESLQREREARTILRFLSEQMDGVDRERMRRRSFKERLGFKVMGCCGANWGLGSTTMSVRDDDVEEEEESGAEQRQGQERGEAAANSGHSPRDPGCPVSSGMNLAAALAAERHFRAAQEPEGGSVGPESNAAGAGERSPLRVSLMRLLEEAGEEELEKGGGGVVGSDSVCCVCMGRKKGAAFIPCGHTFCRVCSRELWLNRGSCPLCNRSILEILDIF